GVARDVKYETLTELPRMYLYLPLLQQHRVVYPTLLVRAGGRDFSALTEAVGREVRGLDRNTLSYRVRPLAERLQGSLAPQRSTATLLGMFGLLALIIANVGLYGLLAYAVGQRRQEFGIRIALGANPSDILRLVLTEGATLIVGGISS